ncbi:hypothetical protein CDD82_7267 [Ophiocordyceps australis]|uniref:Microcystin LR degradation protein MlrC N-terminal domain-containing protein n=1 Tax=Ophiocordyceps australis TaxID=1399860 RepID=A0A2C5YR53_9HYPO|nr:hypothetical protein CDD82_7267 [Ophiocordyceps australis]
MSRLPVVAVAGLACETCTFTPLKTLAADFRPKRGHEIIDYYGHLHDSQPLGKQAAWRGALIGHALPGGIVVREAFEALAGEIMERLGRLVAGEGLDGLWLDIHGAMCVQGMDDAEAELLRRIRGLVGPDVIVSASMDLHGNVSRQLVHMCDAMTCYRTAPHEDELETKERACRHLLDLLQTRRPRPLKAWIPIPILLPGEKTSTRMDPAKRLYAAVAQVAAQTAVLEAAVWVGYPWADEPRNRAAVVVTGWEEAQVSQGAQRLAGLFWDAHADFSFVAPAAQLDACIDQALAAPPDQKPFFISDSGDNPTAGGSGDVSWGLTHLLGRPEFQNDVDGPVVIYASLPGPEAVGVAVAAGVGATVTVTAGAQVDNRPAPPLTLTGTVFSIKHGDVYAETEVVIQVGSVFAIITKLRKPYHKEKDFSDLGLMPRQAAIVIVKIGYLEPELFDMARGWMLALTPGGVDQDLERLGHARIRRPMWPFDQPFAHRPNLQTRWIASSNQPLHGPDE